VIIKVLYVCAVVRGTWSHYIPLVRFLKLVALPGSNNWRHWILLDLSKTCYL